MAKNHFRKVYKSDHLSCADLEDFEEQGSNLIFTIKQVKQEFGIKVAGKKMNANIAYFVENIKPLVVNAGNGKIIKKLTDSPFVEDWNNITVKLYIEESAVFQGEKVGGIRISPQIIKKKKVIIVPENENLWNRAISSYKQNKSFDLIEKHAEISKENKQIIIGLCEEK